MKISYVQIPVIFFGMLLFGGTHFIFLLILFFRHRVGLIWTTGKHFPELYLIGFLSAALNLMSNWGLMLSSPANASILQRGDLFFSLIIGFIIWKQKLRRLELAGMGVMLFGVSLVLQIFWHNFQIGSQGDLLILGSAFLLAVNAEIIKHRLGQVENIMVAYYNSGMCFYIFFGVAACTGELKILPKAESFIWALVTISIILQVVQYLFYYRALQNLSTWLVRIVHLLTPIVAIITSAWWLKMTISLYQTLGMLMVTGGIIIISRVHTQGLVTDITHSTESRI